MEFTKDDLKHFITKRTNEKLGELGYNPMPGGDDYFEYNEESGELRATVEFPIGENRLTASQIKSCLLLLLGVIDSADPVIRHAMKTGLVDLECGEKIEEDSDKKELNDLLKKAGGIEGLRKLAAEAERAKK